MELPGEINQQRMLQFMAALGAADLGLGRVYFTGGVSAVIMGWRECTGVVDLKAEPEPSGLFETLSRIEKELSISFRQVNPVDFVPELPGWRERSAFIARHGGVDFLHHDFYSQLLSKLERYQPKDQQDVSLLMDVDSLDRARFGWLFQSIRPSLAKYPKIDAASLEARVRDVVEGRVPKA